MSRSRLSLGSISSRLQTRGAVALIGALLVLALSGCASGGDSPASGTADLGEAPAAQGGSLDEGQAPAEEAAADRSGEGSRASELSQVSLTAERRQIMTAGLVVETDNVLSAARQAETIAIGAGGIVTDEDTQVQRHDVDGAEDGAGDVTVSSLTIRVPPSALDEVLESLADLGTFVSQNRGTTDVTDEYVDIQARLDSQRASLDRLLQLVGTAGDLDDVIALENEIARRQADLDGLAARLQSLEEETDLATVALTLTSEPEAVVTKTSEGFLAGLDNGWQAFTDSVVAALTVLGALVPFAALVALVGIPFLMIRRRRLAAANQADRPSVDPPAAQA